MVDQFTILIADRNPRVRGFLGGELIAEGYHVQLAKDGREVLNIANVEEPPELVVLDLDVPYVSGLNLLEELQNRKPPVPVVIYTFLTEYAKDPAVQRAQVFGRSAAIILMALRQLSHRY